MRLLTERDRDKFATGKIHLSPGGKEKAYEQKFYLYMNLTKPSETLDIYYSKVSADGKSIRPSYLIQEMQRLFSGLEIEDEEKQAFSAQEWTPKLGMQKVIRGFQDGNAMDSGMAGIIFLVQETATVAVSCRRTYEIRILYPAGRWTDKRGG